jgi:hypothetical protein
MRKWILIGIGIVIVIFSSYVIFSDEFSNIKLIQVQKIDRDSGVFSEEIVTLDSDEIKIFTEILKNAKKEKNVFYDMENGGDYKIDVRYENDTVDGFIAWNNEGRNVFLLRGSENETFSIDDENQAKEFLELLK